MIIRQARNMDEVLEAFRIEEISYSPEAAASREAFLYRFSVFPAFFLIAEHEGQIVGVTNGVRVEHDQLDDDSLKQAAAASPAGMNLCILTVAVAPDYRRRGIAHQLMNAVVSAARQISLHTIVLMCEKPLIPFYEKHGFRYLHPSPSQHGGIEWHEMKLVLS